MSTNSAENAKEKQNCPYIWTKANSYEAGSGCDGLKETGPLLSAWCLWVTAVPTVYWACFISPSCLFVLGGPLPSSFRHSYPGWVRWLLYNASIYFHLHSQLILPLTVRMCVPRRDWSYSQHTQLFPSLLPAWDGSISNSAPAQWLKVLTFVSLLQPGFYESMC